MQVLRQLSTRALDIATNPRHTQWLCPLLLIAEIVLLAGIIAKVPYTEIDWRAYMEQIGMYLAGERDYTKIRGGTGPLVYPAAHVYIYRGLYAFTDKGSDVRVAQYIFAGLYLGTLGVVMVCYRLCKVPPYVFPLLVLSKRLHSIFVLRLFNDCFAVAFLFLAILCFQKRLWTVGAVMYSVGLATKMTLLLALPAIAVVLFQALGAGGALRKAGVMLQVQILLGMPFLSGHPRSYLSRAFELSRAFLFKWTVNWRFVGEEVFLSKKFAIGLLGCHALLLVLFAWTRWLCPSRQSPLQALVAIFKAASVSPSARAETARRVTPRFIMVSILSANAIGMLCARSLHYQFYAMIAWSSPFLLWSAGVPPVVLYVLWSIQEIAWNVYPSTDVSSLAVVVVLGITVAATWYGNAGDRIVFGYPRQKGHVHSE